jgi:TolA-binding protein
MSAAPCPRLFEAEALRDGRLAGTERASFERHVEHCPACQREVRALEALGVALRANAAPDAVDELRTRRARTRLLAAFDRALVDVERRSVPRWLAWSTAAVAVLSLSLVALWRARSKTPPVVATAAVAVHAEGGAIWSSRVEGSREVVVLTRGALRIHIDHSAGAKQLTVELPDGELEDVGTTFTVTVESGHTARVAVEEGRVVVRVRGRSPITLGAGDLWTAPAPSATASPASSAPSSAQSSIVLPQSAAAPASGASAAAGPVSREVASDPSADFRGAMAALDRGDNREAADGFGRFLRTHPRSARAEDAAYLRVIALQRCGDHDETTDAALEYLRRYPAGFRRSEVEVLSR